MVNNKTVPSERKMPFKWKYFLIAFGLSSIIIFSTNGVLDWWNTPKWIITILRAISFTLILPFFAAYFAVKMSEEAK